MARKKNNLLELYEDTFTSFRTYKWGHTVEEILSTCIEFSSFCELLAKSPESFNFNHLTVEQKVILLNEKLSVFSKYISIDELPEKYKVLLFLKYPSLKKYIDWNTVAKSNMDKIAIVKPHYFKKYNLPLKVSDNGWRGLINYSDEYADEFLLKISEIRNKTSLRSFLLHKEFLINKLTETHLEDSVLNAKEWLLFFSRYENRNPKFKLSQNVRDWLDMQFHMDVLSGTSKTSVHTKKARKQ